MSEWPHLLCTCVALPKRRPVLPSEIPQPVAEVGNYKIIVQSRSCRKCVCGHVSGIVAQAGAFHFSFCERHELYTLL